MKFNPKTGFNEIRLKDGITDEYLEEVAAVIDEMTAIAKDRRVSVVRDALIHMLAMALIYRNDTYEEAREDTGRAGHQVCRTVEENWRRTKGDGAPRHVH